MQRELKLYLWDMRGAGADILRFTKDKTFEQYLEDGMLRAAVERKFEIIGEALVQARELYPEIRNSFVGAHRIVAFRNRVAHGYFSVDDALVWSVSKVYLPSLLEQVNAALATIEA